jgi:putative endonuclease
MQEWYIYILKCSDNSFYTGITTDLEERIKRHNSGDGARYTRTRKPVRLIYSEGVSSKSEAKRREIEIKSFSKENKERLIKGRGFPSPLMLK